MTSELKIIGNDPTDVANQVATWNSKLSGTVPPGGGTPPPDQTGDNSSNPNDWSPEKVTAVYFPDDSALAKFPSPEGSKTVCDTDGTIHGRPYVVSAGGVVYQFQKGADGKGIVVPLAAGDTRPPGHKLLCGGTPASSGGDYDAMVAQGQVYFHVAPGNQTLKTSAIDSPGSGTTVTSIPILWSDPFFGSYQSSGSGGGSGGSGGNTGGVPMPPDPPAQSVAYGSTGKTILFGSDQPNKTIASALAIAKPGDVVKPSAAAMGQTFAESFDIPDCVLLDLGGRWTDVVAAGAALKVGDYAKIDSLWSPGATLDGSSLPPSSYSHGLGGAIFLGNGKIMGALVEGFGNQSTQHDGTAGIRAKGNCIGQVQGDHVYIKNCQNGISNGTYGQTISGPWTNTVIVDCGLAIDDGGAHNVYDSGGVVRSFFGPYFYSSVKPFPKGGGGHAIKSRAPAVTVTGPGYLYSGDSSSLDIPNGTSLVATVGAGIVIEKRVADINHTVIGYGAENQLNGVAGLKVAAGVTIIANCTSPNVLSNGPIDFAPGVTFQGGKLTNIGSGTMTGA